MSTDEAAPPQASLDTQLVQEWTPQLRGLGQRTCSSCARVWSWKKGPFLIADNISKPAFEIWADKQDRHWLLAWEPSQLEEDCVEGGANGTGFCWLYGDPDDIHEMTIGHISMEMAILLNDMGARPLVRFMHSARRRLIRRQKEPDWSMVPKDEHAFCYI